MSLDVYLTAKGHVGLTDRAKIFIREDGQRKCISREEWDRRFPDREPFVAIHDVEDDRVFSANITHNLGWMAKEAGIYTPLWRHEEMGITHASQLIGPLAIGLENLKRDPERLKQFAHENGWGTYDGLVQFVEEYLAACRAHPDAEVSSRR